MVKALARAFRWRKMLDTGVHATVEDLARAKALAPSYVSRVLRLTLLAPEIVEAILDGTQPVALTPERLKRACELPLLWDEQRAMLGVNELEDGDLCLAIGSRVAKLYAARWLRSGQED